MIALAYKNIELIKNFNPVRDYMREFFVYGFKNRGDFDEKSGRTYDDRRRQIESWLGDYMSFKHSASGKAQFISVDSREVIHNPLYKAFKTNSFTDYDILLHFCLLDMLSEDDELSISDIVDRLQLEYFDEMNQGIIIEEKTVRTKLQNYTKLGILAQKTGIRKKQYYSLAINRIDLRSWFDAISFFSETSPIGVIGSFLLDQKELRAYQSSFWFKHHYMLYAVDSEIAECILEGIAEKKVMEIATISKRKKSNKLKVYPIKLYVSTQNGREYLLCHEIGGSGINFVRIDNIRECKIKGKCDNYLEYENKYESSKPYLWGVICGNAKDITHIEMTIRIAENEDFIVNRLEREKRNGHVYKINNHQYKYVVDTYDAMELMPWIRTFIGRIENLESSNSYLKEKFNEDMKKMYSMYLGGDDHAI